MTTPREVPCPVCGRPAPLRENPARPFCSARCKTIDLGEWASERHVIPGSEGEAMSAEDEPDSS